MKWYQLLLGKKSRHLIGYKFSHHINLSDGDYHTVYKVNIKTVKESIFGTRERHSFHTYEFTMFDDLQTYFNHWDDLIKNKTTI